MPVSKKPRRGRRARPTSDYPTLVEVAMVFEPGNRILAACARGEIEAIQGRPCFYDAISGEWWEVAPALEGWADAWERVARGERLAFTVCAIRRVAACLRHGRPLFDHEVSAAQAELDRMQAAMPRITRARLRAYSQAAQIGFELERLGMRA